MRFHWKFIRVFQEKLHEEFTNERNNLQSKMAEIEATLNDGDHALDEKIKTAKLNLESVKNGMTNQIEQVRVSLNKYIFRISGTDLWIYWITLGKIEWRIYEWTKWIKIENWWDRGISRRNEKYTKSCCCFQSHLCKEFSWQLYNKQIRISRYKMF